MNKKRILLVEDDELIRELILEFLSSSFDVVEASDGKFATEILVNQKFDLVLSDLQMPRFTGNQLLSWILANQPEVPFVAMSGYSGSINEDNAVYKGAKAYLSKPFKASDLKRTLNTVLGLPTITTSSAS